MSLFGSLNTSIHKDFLIRSVDRVTGGTSSNFTVPLTNQYTSLNNVWKVELVGLTMPNSLYNVRTDVNDTVLFRRSSTDYAGQVAAGNYTMSELLTAIATAMTAADSNNYAATLDDKTMKVTITGTGAFVVNFFSTAHARAAYGMHRELGFLTTADSASGTSVTGNNVADLSGPLHMFINLPDFPIGSQSTYTQDRPTFVVPINVGRGETLIVDETNDYNQNIEMLSPITLSALSVKLFLDQREAANLNGVEWAMKLRFHQRI